MDETTIDLVESLSDGFKGQRMVVVPRPVVRAALERTVTSRLLVTDAGFFPHATRHGRTRPLGTGQHILMLCTDGSGTITMDDETYTLRKGDVALIPAGVAHSYRASTEDAWTLWWFHCIGPDAAEFVAAAHKSAQSPVTHLRDATPVASLISQIIDSLDSTTQGGLAKAAGAAWYALTHIIATGRRQPGPTLNPVEQAVEHLRATAPKRTSVDQLAAMVGLSASQFGALFKQQLGVPPLRFQNDLRMARARELLDSTDLSVSSVSTACGFDDPLYFSRQFTKAHGESPTEYRNRAI